MQQVRINRSFIENEMKYWKIPGMAVVLIQEEYKDQIECFGYRDAETKTPVTENTLFCIASCSKSMNAALMARLCDEGILDIDVPVIEYVPFMKWYEEETTEKITLRDMLCHRSGLPPHDELWPGDETRESLARRLRYLEPSVKFRTKAIYNNTVYAVSSFVAEYVTGDTWPNLMKKYLFKPLEMSRTCCLGKAFNKDSNFALPHRNINGKSVPVPYWNMDLAGGAAAVNSTAVDMAKWLHMHINFGSVGDKEFISTERFADMHIPQIDFAEKITAMEGVAVSNEYCLGWKNGSYRGHPIQKHSGKIEGYSSLQIYLPEEKVGMIILMNLHEPSVPISYTIVNTILDEILGYDDINWSNRFHNGELVPDDSCFHECESDFTKRLDKEVKGQAAQFTNAEIIGVYEHPGYGKIHISIEKVNDEEKLFLFHRDQNLELKLWGTNQYYMENVLEDIWLIKMPVWIETDEEGYVNKVKILYEEQIKPIEFIKK